MSERQGSWGTQRGGTFSRDVRGQSPIRKFLGSKEHLDWLIIDSNAAKIIETINAHKINANGSTLIQQC